MIFASIALCIFGFGVMGFYAVPPAERTGDEFYGGLACVGVGVLLWLN